MTISTSTHPDYVALMTRDKSTKWRLTFESGLAFKNEYLCKFSNRETRFDFNKRRDISHVPSHAKAAVDDVIHAIFQRIADVIRRDGSKSYMAAVVGKAGGVDRDGNSMGSFVGKKILPEMLSMKRVGVYVDMPKQVNILAVEDKTPYIYIIQSEDIRNWEKDIDGNLLQLVIRFKSMVVDKIYGLPKETTEIYRHFRLSAGQVVVSDYMEGKPVPFQTAILNIPEIPFTLFELSDSLLSDTADIQIELLNLNSSDISYALRSNFPFYVEQYDSRANAPHLKHENDDALNATDSSNRADVGPGEGRRYAEGQNPPEFIHPSPEPLEVSMKKQESLKLEIRQISNLSLSSIKPSRQSADSKELDERGLEAGISNIAIELEHGENEIARMWSLYESAGPATITYPKRFKLITDSERLEQAEKTQSLAKSIPSPTFQRKIAQVVAHRILEGAASDKVIQQIDKEIENSPVINMDPEVVSKDIEQGVVSAETAAKAKGYPDGETSKAQEEQARRIELIQKSQTSDVLPDPRAEKEEKEDA